MSDARLVRALHGAGRARQLTEIDLSDDAPGVQEFPLGLKVRAVLGVMSQPAQQIAMRGAWERADREQKELCQREPERAEDWRPVRIRVRHLDFASAIAMDRMYDRADEDGRRRIAGAVSFLTRGALPEWWKPVEKPFHPSYPELRPGSFPRHDPSTGDFEGYLRAKASAKLVLGARPIEVSPPGLTSREAHLWLKAGMPEVTQWLLETATGPVLSREWPDPVEFHNRLANMRIRTIPVVRWVSAVLKDPARREALFRARDIAGPHGEVLRMQFIDRVDEIRDEDLVRGPATSVDDVMRAAAQRTTEATLAAMREQHQVLARPPPWWKPRKFARLLDTPAALVQEGREMSHCVGAYSTYVRERRSVIVAIGVLGDRSTAELDWETGRVLQHRGPSNEPPSLLCEKALKLILKDTPTGQMKRLQQG